MMSRALLNDSGPECFDYDEQKTNEVTISYSGKVTADWR
jgi:hypothetical protein